MTNIDDLIDTAHHHGTRHEVAALADIAKTLTQINNTLHLIADALTNPAPWNVTIR
jgi:hypothetical protein